MTVWSYRTHLLLQDTGIVQISHHISQHAAPRVSMADIAPHTVHTDSDFEVDQQTPDSRIQPPSYYGMQDHLKDRNE